MKKLLVMAMLAIGSAAFAEDYKYLTMGYNNVEKSIELATIRKITFEDGKVVVATSKGEETFPVADMQRMFFSANATGIDEVMKQGNDETEKLHHIYDLSGRRISVPSVSSVIPKGVYIINGKKVVR